MVLLGFSAGLPILLIFSSLSIWLREAGVEKSAVTLFSWAALAYSFKFVWAPLVDRLPIPILAKFLGQRRSWLLLSQLMIMAAINVMATTNPALGDTALIGMALGAVLLGFSSATQDIVIDAYRIEVGTPAMQGILSASYTAGYRIGMIVAGAGALYLADYLGTTHENYVYEAWQITYRTVSLFGLMGLLTTLLIKEPGVHKAASFNDTKEYLKVFFTFILLVVIFIVVFNTSGTLTQFIVLSLTLSSPLALFLFEVSRFLISLLCCVGFIASLAKLQLINRTFFWEGYCHPVTAFFNEHGKKSAWLVLCFIGLFRSSDIVLGVISNVFYTDMGFSKSEIASAVKTFGLLVTIIGGFIGGFLCLRIGVMRMLWHSTLVVMVTNLLFVALVFNESNILMLYLVVAADNLAGGLATTAFIAFLSSLVDVRFTAMQYAIFSSLMTLFPKLLGGYSGAIVENLGYVDFFIMSASLCLPVLLLLMLMRKHFDIDVK